MKLKEFGPPRGRVPRAPLDPPLAYVVYYFAKIYFKLVKIEAQA